MKNELLELLEIIDLRLESIERDLESQKVLIDQILMQCSRNNSRKKLEKIFRNAWVLERK